MNRVDLAIIGGGLAGASLALALKDSGLSIAVLEAIAPKIAGPAQFDARVLALAEGSRCIYQTLGLWEALAPYATPIRHIHISDRGHFGMSRLHAEDEGVEALGRVLEMRDLGRVLFNALAQLSNVRVYCPNTVTSVRPAADAALLTLDNGESIAAQLVVAADGGDSALRKSLGIVSRHYEYQQSAVIANVLTSKAHQGWAFERFTDSGPLALLPMSQGRASLVWSVRPQDVEALLALDDAAFLTRLQERFGWRLGRFIKVGTRQAYALTQSCATEQVRPRVVVLGNAAHSLHPIAGQGFNLTLRDVAVLAELLAERARGQHDLGELSVLRAYLEARRADQARVIGATDALARLFANDFPPLVCARNMALKILESVPGLKSPLAQAAMGLSGTAPNLVRGLAV